MRRPRLTTLYLQSFGITDPGLRRSSNEDAFHADSSTGCFAVADGVGGAAAGEVASSTFIQAVSQRTSRRRIVSEQDAVGVIKDIFFTANTKIYEQGVGHPDYRGMACTAELMIVLEHIFVLGHVGDSRSYRYRNHELVCLTVDHSFVQQQIDLGTMSEAEARTHRLRNVVVRAVGNEERIDVDIVRGKVRKGDLFLICSDGLTDMLPESEIAEWIGGDAPVEEKALSLVARANQAGGRDNITVVLVAVM